MTPEQHSHHLVAEEEPNNPSPVKIKQTPEKIWLKEEEKKSP